MKTNNMTEIKIDQLVTVTGGYVDAVGPVEYPYKAVGPVNELRSCDPPLTVIGTCDPALTGTGPLPDGTRIPPKCVGPVAYPYKTGPLETGPLGYETGPL